MYTVNSVSCFRPTSCWRPRLRHPIVSHLRLVSCSNIDHLWTWTLRSLDWDLEASECRVTSTPSVTQGLGEAGTHNHYPRKHRLKNGSTDVRMKLKPLESVPRKLPVSRLQPRSAESDSHSDQPSSLCSLARRAQAGIETLSGGKDGMKRKQTNKEHIKTPTSPTVPADLGALRPQYGKMCISLNANI